ncbi:hypothetical protein O181_011904 [Austropuccinia psidii MF-1]|uniref:Uncharacterized protein n=1 Tax=Austropuccinia psidii MF-1 TaxID=1389203 RepID=A0A9Q3BVC7_9BASI|nr:hypothetical protein [Austropuccinia psidii MF-1]
MPPKKTTTDAVRLKTHTILRIKVMTLSMLKMTIMLMNLCILKPLLLDETSHDETPPTSPQNIQAFQEREKIEHDTIGQEDMTDIMPGPEPKVLASTDVQGIFLSHIEEFEEIFNYHLNISQE